MRLLPDKPQSQLSNQKVNFAYTSFSKSIVEIIKSSPRPFTIGLFGKWGTGKSTIIENLRSDLNKNENIFIKFDVWKYEKDALRRSFLLDMALQLKGRWRLSAINDKYIEELKGRLYNSTQRSEEKFKFSWKKTSIPIIALIVIAGFYYWFDRKPVAAALAIAVAVLTADALRNSFLDKSNFIQDITIGKDRVTSPEEFYTEFRQMLAKTKKTAVIVIDNLDRTQKDKTIELLSTIKTFLNADDSNENVVFIIACDDKAIKEHIAAVYAPLNPKTIFDPNEFLKKFFNVVIELPVFVESEIVNYTKKLLNETEIDCFVDNSDLQQIINYGYSQNPREIKQYINNLAAFYILLINSSPDNGLTEEFIKDNLNFICKLLVIRDKYSEVYEDIKELSISNAKSWTEISAIKEGGFNEPLFDTFNNLTEWVEPTESSITWAFRLRRSKEDMALPGWDQYISFSLQQDYDNAEKLFQEFTDLDALNTQLTTYLTSIHGDRAKMTPFISVLLRLFLTLDKDSLNKLKSSIDLSFQYSPGEDMRKIIEFLDVDKIIGVLAPLARPNSQKQFVRALRASIGSQTANITVSDEKIANILQAYSNNQSLLKNLSSAITDEISRSHLTDYVFDFMSKNGTLIKEIATSKPITAYIQAIDPKDPEATNKFDLLTSFDIRGNADPYIAKISQTFISEVVIADIEKQKRLVRAFLKTLQDQSNVFSSLSADSIASIGNMFNVFQGFYSTFPGYSDKIDVVLLIKTLLSLPGVPANIAVDTMYQEVATNADINDLPKIINDDITSDFKSLTQDSLVNRALNKPEEAETIFPYLDEAKAVYLISQMIDRARGVNNLDLFRTWIDRIHKLYLLLSTSARTQLNDPIFNLLQSGVNTFPDVVGEYVRKTFITAQQRQVIQQALTALESDESSNSQ